MPRTRANGIEIEYETFGDASRPSVLLVMGFSLQLVSWDERFCEGLVSRGFHVVRFDNRDVGLSSKLEGGPSPDIGAIMGGDAKSASYALDDMADDAVGLLDALGIAAADVVGVSMGGMIAQLMALRHPSRVRSLCSIMSSTGDRSVGQPRPAALSALFTPAPAERGAYIEHGVALWRTISSPSFPFDEARVRGRLARGYDRCYSPAGVARQLAAILTQRDRTPELARVKAPTLVIHGKADPLIDASGGEATARAIPAAELLLIEGMGHDLAESTWPRMLDAIAANASRGVASAS